MTTKTLFSFTTAARVDHRSWLGSPFSQDVLQMVQGVRQQQQLEESTTIRSPSRQQQDEPSKQILKMVCGSGGQRLVLQGKPFVMPFTRTPKTLKDRVSPYWFPTLWLHFVAWSRRQQIASSSPKWSRTIILTTVSNSVTSIKILSPLRSGQPMTRNRFCFFFCSRGSVYWEILGEDEIVDSTLFCKQLEEMETNHIRQGKILLLMDSEELYHAKITQQKLKDLEMEWLSIHPILRTSLRAISMHFGTWKTSAVDGTSKTAKTCSSHCGLGLRPGLKTSGGEDSNNFQNDGEQSWKHTESTTTIAGTLKLSKFVIKLKFWKVSLLVCHPNKVADNRFLYTRFEELYFRIKTDWSHVTIMWKNKANV